MVKIKGYRVELGEIENILASHPEVNQVVVVACGNTPLETQLHCHYISDRKVSIDEFNKFLSQRLPHYMIPESFTRHTSLPHTSTGKIDRMLLAKERKKL